MSAQLQIGPGMPLIRRAGERDLPVLWGMADRLHGKEHGYFEHNLEEQYRGRREIFIAGWPAGGEGSDPADAAYCILNWDPKYGYFRAHGIPETQDLNVLREYRRRGIATALIAHCEGLAIRKGHKVMGISVGLYDSYGPAQKLYVKLGYAPDGYGVTYDRKTVIPGEMKPVDDNLCLMMVREL